MEIEEGEIEPFIVSEPNVEEVLEITSYMDNKARAEAMKSLFPSELEMKVRSGFKIIGQSFNGVIHNARTE